MRPPVTTPEGAVVTKPALPTVYEAEPSPTCERVLATFHGKQPARMPVVIPPTPGLRAVATTTRTTRLEWSFQDLPDDCRPEVILVSVEDATNPNATPTTEQVPVDGETGSAEVSYPDFLGPPNVARASAMTRRGLRSRTVTVLIRRSDDVPADPPEPAPPVTAPAGAPISCSGPATVVSDPPGDVLTYAPGSPPAQVPAMSDVLKAIDVTRASMQIDGRTMCATLELANAPGDADFTVLLTLRDTSTSSCCASLHFRQTAGQLEVGFRSYADGVRGPLPVAGGGAAVRGRTLTITGTLPTPDRWEMAARRMPAPATVGWSLTTSWYESKYGPYYGDWLPAHDDVNEPVVRHRDGAIVRPAAAR